jgi:hypothetical protein
LKNEQKTKEQLINELAELRQQISKLEKSEAERKQAVEALCKNEEELKKKVKDLEELCGMVG